MKTYQDPAYKAAAKKIGLDVEGVSGEKVEQMALKIMDVPEATKRKNNKILGR